MHVAGPQRPLQMLRMQKQGSWRSELSLSSEKTKCLLHIMPAHGNYSSENVIYLQNTPTSPTPYAVVLMLESGESIIQQHLAMVPPFVIRQKLTSKLLTRNSSVANISVHAQLLIPPHFLAQYLFY